MGYCISCNLTNCLWCYGTNICAECRPGTFLDGVKCTVCAAPCLLCSSASNCSKCSAAYFVNTANGCTLCDSSCLRCVDREGCVQCNSSAPALFSIVGGVCTNCNLTACLSCSAPLVCSSCRNGTYLSAGKCLSCQIECFSCVGLYNCLTCS
jgi:proprotein convertase subtilisin/kexin type 5